MLCNAGGYESIPVAHIRPADVRPVSVCYILKRYREHLATGKTLLMGLHLVLIYLQYRQQMEAAPSSHCSSLIRQTANV